MIQNPVCKGAACPANLQVSNLKPLEDIPPNPQFFENVFFAFKTLYVMQHGKLSRVRQKIESQLSTYHESRDSYLFNSTKIILLLQLVPV